MSLKYLVSRKKEFENQKKKKQKEKGKKIKSNPLEATPSSLLIYARIRKGIKKKGEGGEEDMGRGYGKTETSGDVGEKR